MKKHIYLFRFILAFIFFGGTAMAQPIVTASIVSNVSCNGGSDGAVTCSATAGMPPYTYSWSPGGATVQSPTGLPAGVYTVTVTDNMVMSSTATVTVNQPTAINITPSSAQTICIGSSASISASASGGTPAYVYGWSPATGLSCSSCASTTASPASTTVYTVNVTDITGCSSQQTVAVTVNPLPPVLISPSSTTICFGANTTLTASGAVAYSWNTGANTSSILVGPSTTTSYTVNGTDLNGCTASYSANVIVSPPLSVTTNATGAVCNGQCNGSIVATPSGGSAPYTYQWLPGGQSAVTATNLCAGNYTVTVTDNLGCQATMSDFVSQPAPFSVSLNPFDVTCFGACNGGGTAIVSGGVSPVTYNWSPSGGNQDYTSGLCPGTYSFMATDANGCTASSNMNVYEPAALSVSASPVNISCHGVGDGSISIAAAGGTAPYSYQWGNFSGSTITNLGPGMYAYTVTDANSCTYMDSIQLFQPAPIVVTFTPTSPSCGAANGMLVSAVSGGTAPYAYFWSNGSTASSLSNIPSGQYYLNVKDANNCAISATGSLNDAGGPAVALNAVTDVTCNGLSNGSILTTISGGTAPLTIQWMNGAATDDLLNIPAGTYDLSVTDASGCVVYKSYTVNEPAPLYLSGTATSTSACAVADGSASAVVNGGTSPYTYLWDANAGNQTTSTAAGLAAGAYKVSVSDLNGCSDSVYISVNDPGLFFSVVIDSVVQAGCLSSGNVGNGAIYPKDLGAGYSYSWTNGNATTFVTGLGKGIYGVTITETASGCKASWSTYIYGILPGTPQLCLVTVDTSNNHNIIVWEKDIPGIQTYYIYRESSSPGSYNLIATIPADSLSQYEDTLANASVQPWNYEIKVVDSCGSISYLSYNHQSIFLTIAQGSGSNVDLSWTDYLGTSFNYYYIYRKSTTSPWALIDSVAAGTLVYSDINAPTPIDSIDYLVEIQPSTPCNPTRGAINTSRSNIKNTSARQANGIKEAIAAESKITVFPNPAQSELYIKTDRKGKYEVQLFDVTGRKINQVNTELLPGNQSKINTSGFEPGVYILKVVYEDGKVNRTKFIKQ